MIASSIFGVMIRRRAGHHGVRQAHGAGHDRRFASKAKGLAKKPSTNCWCFKSFQNRDHRINFFVGGACKVTSRDRARVHHCLRRFPERSVKDFLDCSKPNGLTLSGH